MLYFTLLSPDFEAAPGEGSMRKGMNVRLHDFLQLPPPQLPPAEQGA